MTAYWTSSSGLIDLEMTLERAASVSHSGRCDDDVDALSLVPEIAKQLEAIKADDLRRELKEYGAWDAEELVDHQQNLQRVLWLAGCDIKERAGEEDEDAE